MKSKQDESNSCEGCIFALMGQPIELAFSEQRSTVLLDVQTDCACDRLHSFVDNNEAYMTVGSPHFKLARLCNTKRGKEWQDEQSVTFIEDLADEARHEVKPLFGIAVQDHPDSTLEDLQVTLQSIAKLNYPKQKIKIVISTFAARGINAVMHEINVLQSQGLLAEAIFHVVFDPKVKDTEVFKKLVQSHYFVNIFSGAILDENTLQNIDVSLNDDLEKVVMFENSRGYTVIRKQVVTGLYLQFNNYEDTVDHIRNLAKEKNVYRQI